MSTWGHCVVAGTSETLYRNKAKIPQWASIFLFFTFKRFMLKINYSETWILCIYYFILKNNFKIP